MKRLIILIWFFAISTVAYSQSDTLGRWFTRAPLPTPRQEIPHAVLDGKIYVPGGLASGGIGSTIVEVFDPSTNSWSTAAPLPEPLHHLGFTATNGKLYVLGGYVGNSFTPMNRVYEYVPDSNLWRQKTSMPATRGAHIALTFQDKIYVIGGIEGGVGVSRRNDEYDPINDSWQTKTNMPTAREHLAGAVIDSSIYVAGGRVSSSNRNTLEAYSPASNTWYTKANMPTARGGLATATLRGRLYAFGGEIPGVYPQNEEYNPATNTWRTMAPMPTPRHGIGAAAVGDSIFIIGGAAVQGFGVTNVNEVFTLAPLTSVNESRLNAPSNFVLYQNFPNPFNPSTEIQFDLPKATFVSLKIFDMLGREVSTLANEHKQPGTYRVTWDARQTNQPVPQSGILAGGGQASGLPSGMYFYRLIAKNSVQTRKMLLIK